MMLLASLPFFVVGCYRAVREKNFWILVLVAFFTTPLLYGLATTAYRASRVMAMIPLYSLLATLGAVTFWEYKKAIWGRVFLLTLTLLVAINYFDFTNYYWFTYPKATENIFGHLNEYQSFAALSKEAAGRNLTPYISANLMDNPNVQQLFYQSIYFPQGVKVIKHDSLPPQGSILITDYEKMPGMERINLSLPAYSLHIRR